MHVKYCMLLFGIQIEGNAEHMLNMRPQEYCIITWYGFLCKLAAQILLRNKASNLKAAMAILNI